ncbi:MAG: hypothetical protein ACHQ1D_05060 [Nitrososphaerales archaeon]|jgi:predicted KAP-like P-loop ATPase
MTSTTETENPVVQAPSQSPQPQQQPVTVQQILVKMILDGQQNINKLIQTCERLTTIQENQMIYINMLINNVNNNGSNESTQNGFVQSQSGTIQSTAAATAGTKASVKPSNNQPIT